MREQSHTNTFNGSPNGLRSIQIPQYGQVLSRPDEVTFLDRRLYDHIREEINHRTLVLAGEKLGGEYRDNQDKTQEFLTRIARRCSEEGRPFYSEVRRILSQPFQQSKYSIFTDDQRRQLVEVLAAYFRAPSFLARYLPLDDPDVQRAWELGEGRREVLEPGIQALRRGIEEQTDQSNQTYIRVQSRW